MNKALIVAGLSALAFATPLAAQAARTPAAVIVLVDTSRIYAECVACRAANTQIQALVTSGQTRAQALRGPLEAEAASIQTAGQAAQAMPAGAARTAAENALRTRVQAYQAREAAAQQELQRLDQNIQSVQQNVVRQLDERVNPLITQAMTTHGANIAMDFRATIAHAPAVDITNEVLAALNTGVPSVSVTPLPQAPAAQQPQGR
ncbi:MAG: outer rane chaperone Skp [Alphaproteobacteria bacterium]|nr:outer rane chaperone Skp [Alphaproteobacteria bacterium]MDB5720068.1 outer rane chaperone Skp [Alphaproteobacteria bacterium]